MGLLDGLTLDLAGLDTIDMLAGTRLVYSDATWELHDSFHTFQDVAIQCGIRINKLTNDYQFVLQLNYGHRGSTVPAVTRIPVSATFTFPASNDGGLDADAGSLNFVVDDPPASYVVLSGASVPPTIFVWNSVSRLQVGEVFNGHLLMNVESSLWMRNPNSSGTTERFTFRFDPAREDMSFARMLRGGMYGVTWCEDDAFGKRVRPDLEGFHSNDGESWVKFGTFWMQKTRPASTGNWKHLADGAHADAGYLSFFMAYVHGGPDVWTNTAYHFQVKQFATVFLARFPDPKAGYGQEFHVDYNRDSMRARGRIIACGVWAWRALTKMNEFRTDTEGDDLAVAVANTTTSIFDLLWIHNNPTTGQWIDGGSGDFQAHPDASCASQQVLKGNKYFMGGLYWLGIYHFWEGLRELGLTAHPLYVKARALMDFIAIGNAGRSIDGLIDVIYSWQNSHPFAAPNPLPPAWACASSWPAARVYTISGFGWAWEYEAYERNSDNADLKYLSHPSSATTGQQVPVFEFLLASGMLDTQKLREIIAQYASQPYRYHLGADLRIEIAEAANHTELVVLDAGTIPRIYIEVNDAANHVEVIDEDLSVNTIILVVSEAANNAEALTDVGTELTTVNESADNEETLVLFGLPIGLFLEVNEVWQMGELSGDEVVFEESTHNLRPALLGTGVSVLPALLGGSPMKLDQDFAVLTGEDVIQPFTVTLDAKRNLDGSETWRCQIRDKPSDAAFLVELTSAGGEIEVDGTTFYPRLVFTPALLSTSNFVPTDKPRDLPYDLEMTKDTKVETVAKGKVEVTTDITR